MASQGRNTHVDAHSTPLPLFRPEALAAQERAHGEILLIRPFSLTFVTALLVGVAASVLAILFAGHYDESTEVNASLSSRGTQASFIIPASWVGSLHEGSTLPLRWQPCGGQPQRMSSQVLAIAQLPASEASAASVRNGSSPAKVTVAINAGPSIWNNSSGQLKAEIPRGQRRLIHWFFAQSKS